VSMYHASIEGLYYKMLAELNKSRSMKLLWYKDCMNLVNSCYLKVCAGTRN